MGRQYAIRDVRDARTSCRVSNERRLPPAGGSGRTRTPGTFFDSGWLPIVRDPEPARPDALAPIADMVALNPAFLNAGIVVIETLFNDAR